MNRSIKSKAILSTLLFAVIFTVALFFVTSSFATEKTAEPTPNEALSQTTLDTVETPIGKSGMKLIGDTEAIPGEDYTIDESAYEIRIISDNWTLTGNATHPNIGGWSVKLDCNSVTLKDLTQIDNKTNILMMADEDATADPLTMNIEGENNIWTLVGYRDIILKGIGTLNIFGNYNDEVSKLSGIAGMLVCNNSSSAMIDGPSIFIDNRINTASEIPFPVYIEGDLNINSGKFIVTQAYNIPNISIAIFVSGNINIGDDTELFCSGLNQAIYWTPDNPFGDANNYKTYENFLTYEQRSQANRAATVIKTDIEGTFKYTIGLEDGVTPAKTVYKSNGEEPVPPTPPTPPTPDPESESYSTAQTGDSPLNGIIMLIAVISGVCFASISIRKAFKNRA